MKKTRFFSIAVLSLLTAIACNKEVAEAPIPSSEGVKSYASFTATGEELTKVLLDFADEASNVKWQDADKIAVFDGTSKNEFGIKAGSNQGSSAVFEGEASDAATTLYAVYPADAGLALDGSAVSVSVPSAQVIPAEGCADPAALVAVASGEKGGKLAFKQVCGLLKVSFKATNVREIVISGAALAGTVKVSADGTITEAQKPVDSITLTHADGIFPAGTYYVAVLPGTTPEGFSISLTKGLSSGIREASGPVTFTRAKGVDAGSLDKLTTRTEIKTMAELFDWNANRVVTEESGDEFVVIGADIDMEEEPWVPKDFKGTFDGQGHKLYNLNVKREANASFFNTLTGTMKNISFGTSDGSSYDGKSAIVQENTEDNSESAWRYAGLVTRLAEGSTLDGVTSFVPVTVLATSTSKTRVGGLVGVVAGPATISNCANKGAVTNLATDAIASGVLGGIVGRADAAVTITGTDNEGAVNASSESVTHCAGILASDASSSTITDSNNKGNIVFDATGANAVGNSIGGIIGEAVGSSVSGCSNSGSITNTYDGESKIGGIIGRANGEIPVSIADCTNLATGSISYNPDGATKRAFIGGIIGNSPAAFIGALTIQGCINRAPITGENEQIAAIGGIAGYLNGKGVVTIKSCENVADMTNNNGAAKNGTSAAEAFIAGIVSYLSTGLAAGSSIEGCINRGAVSTVNRNIKSMGGIAAIFQSGNAVTIKDCDNYGAITKDVLARPTCAADSGDNTWYHSISGIAGKVNVGAGSSIVGCTNHSGANIWVNTGGGGAQLRIGGIAGYVVKCPEISQSVNEADITYDNTATGGSYIAIGGVAGHVYNTPAFDSCSNSGAVSSNRTQVNRIGGVIGSVNKTAVTNCSNTGSVTLNCEAQTANWQSIGGIAGFAEGTGDEAFDFTGNVNRGAVEATFNTTNARVAIGGVVGMPYTAFNLKDNVNYGSVTATNKADASACNAGGIAGMELEAGNASTISGNKNYGAVVNNMTGSTKAFTGGLFGTFGKASSADGSNFGSVTGEMAGAVAGSNSAVITVTLCDAVTVNGVTKASAADEAAWLCPANTGTITPTYVAHSAGE